MTKKDYIKLAEVFRVHLQQDIDMNQFSIVNSILTDMMNVLQDDNPLFNKDTFRNAIYKESK
jgi:hypothetical protein